MPISTSAQAFLAGLLAATALLFVQAPARASEQFPAALQEAAGMPCTPSCVVCHGKVPGDIGSFNARKLTGAIIGAGTLPPPGAAGVPVLKADFNAYAMKASTDAEVARVVAALKDGTDPETGDSLCGPTYGCGAHVAKKAPPSDLGAPLWVVGAMLAGGLLRRRRAQSSWFAAEYTMRPPTLQSVLLGFGLFVSTPARASEVFPGALQEAAGMQCVPVCLMCHTTNPGNSTSWTKQLGVGLRLQGASKGDADSLKAAYRKYAADPANAAALADIKAGREPGAHVDVCGPIYGCAVYVAKEAAAPRDFTGPLWAVGAMVAARLLRRRRKPTARWAISMRRLQVW
jgi:MYXO-CTERM domain-containing protein